MNSFANKHLSIILVSGLVLTTILVYLAGLHSRFIFDDFVNLRQLSEIDTYGYSTYVFSGISGPTGRPVSLLTFALQHTDWPDNPFPFKLFNLILHILNGILIYVLMLYLRGKTAPDDITQNRMFAFVTAGLWLLHPIQVNTVLYVVQRMTQLSTFFILLGVLGYLYAKNIFDNGRHRAGLIGMSMAVGMAGILAVLSKENGALLPLYILAIELTVLYSPSRNRIWRIWAWIFLVTPLVIASFYLFYSLGNILEGYASRSFTMSERLLTQPVVLVQYFLDLIIPHLSAFSLFHDDFPKSTGLLNSPRTLLCHVLIFSALGYAFIMRKRTRFVSLGILWFLAGHSLESSHLNLELYFEHRNYLPSAGVFILLAIVITKYWDALSKYITVTCVGAYCLMVLWITYYQVQLWNHPGKQASDWALIHPKSPRAQDYFGSMLLLTENFEPALEVFDRILKMHPNDIYPYTRRIAVTYCLMKKPLTDEEWAEIFDKARHAKKYTAQEMVEFDGISKFVENNECPLLDVPKYIRMLNILADNRNFAGEKGSLHQIAAVLAALTGDTGTALENIDEAIRYKYDAVTLTIKLRFMIALKNKQEAQRVLEMLESYLKDHKIEYLAYKNIISNLKEKLNKL